MSISSPEQPRIRTEVWLGDSPKTEHRNARGTVVDHAVLDTRSEILPGGINDVKLTSKLTSSVLKDPGPPLCQFLLQNNRVPGLKFG